MKKKCFKTARSEALAFLLTVAFHFCDAVATVSDIFISVRRIWKQKRQGKGKSPGMKSLDLKAEVGRADFVSEIKRRFFNGNDGEAADHRDCGR